MTGRGRSVVALVLLAAACRRETRVPFEIDLTATAVTLADGRPQMLEIETKGSYRSIVEPPGATIDLYIRATRDALLRFTLAPQTPDTAFAVSWRGAGTDHVLRPRRSGEGDWAVELDAEDGAIGRLRLENRGRTRLVWWGLRLSGTTPPEPPLLDAPVRPPPGAPLNVILVLSDAMRADHLSLYGHWRPTTPELIRLAAEHGIVFEHAYPAGPSTPNSVPTLFTSRPASAVGLSFDTVAGGGDRTLAEAFNLAGVRTAAFVGNPLLLEKLGYSRGFGTYEIVPSSRGRDRFVSADVLIDRAIEYLSVNTDASCFVYVHLMDTHNPFDPPSPFRGRFAGTESLRPRAPRRAPAPSALPPPMLRRPSGDPAPSGFLPAEPGSLRPGPWKDVPTTQDEAREDGLDPVHYDEAIAFVDAEIGRMMRAIDTLGVGARTVVLLVADHGEALGPEDDGSRLHGHSLYEELAHVPLVALVPWLPAGRRVPDVVSLVDVAPTLLDLAGVPIPASFTGTSLFAERHAPEPRAALLERLNAPWLTTTFIGPGSVVEWGLREGPWKLLLEEPRARLFDLAADPKETTDVGAEHPEIAGYLAGRIARASPALGRGGAAVATVPAGELERPLAEALKQLGYLQ